jgi:hypothetical protein
MPNRFTRVPDGPVPDLPGALRLVIPVADLFMLAMISRPSTGSLRTTWVTPATLQLSLVLTAAGLAIAIVLAASGTARVLPLLVLVVVLILFAAGTGAVAIVGIGQRVAMRGR